MRAAAILTLIATFAAAETLRPVDESASDPEFLQFKVRLLAALERKDVQALMKALDPQVRVNVAGDQGIAAFRRHWKLDRPAQSGIWAQLATTLRLGATRDETEFIAPYVFTRFPHLMLDAYSHAAVVRPGVVLRRSPATGAAKVATLDYDVVQLMGAPRNGWVEVRTPEGKTGWLQQKDIRSPLDYRAFFEKKNGSWKLTAFVTGD